MEMKLSENIRAFRKERSLTQEQLAEVLGVTAGAVYKWEAGLSVPEIELIMEMANFFDTSVDVLLGYLLVDNRLDATVKRLQEYRRNKDRSGLSEAERALKKYPHSFPIVRESASMYGAFGFESGDRALLRRALELFEKAVPLLGQNEDPEISEQTLYGKMAETYLGLGEIDRGVELYRKHNAGGLYSHRIGHVLAVSDRAEEAAPFLSKAMATLVESLCDIVIGYTNVYLSRGDCASAEAILDLSIGFLRGLSCDDKPNFLDKISAAFLAAEAGARFLAGRPDEARDTLKSAKKLAAFFDSSPSYDESDIRFIDRIEGASAYDDIGATAADAVEGAVKAFENVEFTVLWKSVKEGKDNG